MAMVGKHSTTKLRALRERYEDSHSPSAVRNKNIIQLDLQMRNLL